MHTYVKRKHKHVLVGPKLTSNFITLFHILVNPQNFDIQNYNYYSLYNLKVKGLLNIVVELQFNYQHKVKCRIKYSK